MLLLISMHIEENSIFLRLIDTQEKQELMDFLLNMLTLTFKDTMNYMSGWREISNSENNTLLQSLVIQSEIHSKTHLDQLSIFSSNFLPLHLSFLANTLRAITFLRINLRQILSGNTFYKNAIQLEKTLTQLIVSQNTVKIPSLISTV